MTRTSVLAFVLVTGLAGAGSFAAPANDVRVAPRDSIREITWAGKLVDQACKEEHADRTCGVTPATKRFGLVIEGGIIVPLDDASNEIVDEALNDGRHAGNVVGRRELGVFKLKSIEVKE